MKGYSFGVVGGVGEQSPISIEVSSHSVDVDSAFRERATASKSRGRLSLGDSKRRSTDSEDWMPRKSLATTNLSCRLDDGDTTVNLEIVHSSRWSITRVNSPLLNVLVGWRKELRIASV